MSTEDNAMTVNEAELAPVEQAPDTAMEEAEQAPLDPAQLYVALKELVLKLVNFEKMEPEEDVTVNICLLAEYMVESLDDIFEEISELFLKMCCQLSIQVPIMVGLVYQMHLKSAEFGKFFLLKIQDRLISELKQDNVAVSRLLLRTLACFVSAKVLSLSGNGGFEGILEALLVPLEQEIQQRKRSPVGSHSQMNLSDQAQILAYLLSSTVTWCLDAFPAESRLINRLETAFTEVLGLWTCPFGANGRQAMLFRYTVPEDGMKFIGLYEHNERSNGAIDTLTESVKVSLTLIQQWQQSSSSEFILPSCMLAPWKVYHRDLTGDEHFESLTLRSDLHVTISQELIQQQQVIGSRSRVCKSQEGVLSIIGDASSGSGRNFSWLRGRIPLFASDSCGEAETLSSTVSSVERQIIMSYYQDILMFFDPIINANGTYTGTIDTLVGQLLAVNQLFKEDSQRGQLMEYLLGEVLFNILLQQPTNTTLNAQVFRVILTLCKRSTIFPTVVSVATNLVFNILPDLDVCSIHAFAQWFAFHFVNAQYNWPYWSHWESECGLHLKNPSSTAAASSSASSLAMQDDSEHQHGREERSAQDDENGETLPTDAEQLFQCYGQLFCLFILQRCSQIANVDNLEKKLPISFHSMLIQDSRPRWYYLKRRPSSSSSSYRSQQHHPQDEVTIMEGFEHLTPSITNDMKSTAQHILSMIRDKQCDANTILDHLETIPSFVIDEDNHKQILLQIFMECFLEAAYQAKTLTALFNYFARYHEVFIQLADNEESQMILIRTITTIYAQESRMQMILIERFVRNHLLSSHVVANYLVREVQEGESLLFHMIQGTASIAVLSLFHLVVDLSLDLLKMTIDRRRVLGDGIQLHANVDLTPSPMPVENSGMVITEVEEEIRNEEEVEDDDREERRIRRRLNEDEDATVGDSQGRENGASNIETQAVETSVTGETTLWLAEEAVKRALKNTRSVYHILMIHFVQILQNSSSRTSAASDGEANAAKALMLRTLRVYLGHERCLSKELNMEVVLTDHSTTQTVFQTLERVNPAVALSWKEFISM